jgi:multidrug efflux pump subunit AcrB
MNLIRASLDNRPAVAAAVGLVLLFGLLALTRLPLQLFPDIERPQMSVVTNWRAASAAEVEAEILEPQEQVLRGIPGLEEIEGNANAGSSWVNLTFAVGTDMKAALVELLGRLNRLPPLPADADPPLVRSSAEDGPNANLSWFFVQLLPGTPGTIADHYQYVVDNVKPRLEAIPGVALVEVNGAMPEELSIEIDPRRAAELGVAIPDLAGLVGRARDVSGGFVDVGRRQYTLRLAGRYSPEELAQQILVWRDGSPVRLGDVAKIEVKRPQRTIIAHQNGNPALGLRVARESGANVLATLDAVKAEVALLRAGPLAARGLGIEQSFDAGLFIERAINLLSGNLLAGVLLAVGCLWWFLRDTRATLLIASAVPISLLATFVVLDLSGRSLNVISLAGLAFAVGMVMDAAIVVAENIVRLKEGGSLPRDAALAGTRQVAGALVASTLTTIAVFVPVLFLEDVEGQLFADLALTIAIAVAISLLIAITVLPAAAGGWLRAHAFGHQRGRDWVRIADWIMRLTDGRQRQWGWVLGLTLAPLALAFLLLPRLDYLPPVKRAAVDVWFNVPPGMSPETVDREVFSIVRERMAPYMSGEKQPQLKNWYIQAWPGGGTLGARVVDADRIGELERIIQNEIVTGLPDTRAFAREGELFGGFGGSSRAIYIHLQAGDIAALAAAADRGREILSARFPGANVQTVPNADATQTELRALPDDRRLAEAGWTRAELGTVLRTLGNGNWLGEYFDGDRRLDVILRGGGWDTPEALQQVPLATGNGSVLPLGDLSRFETVISRPQLRRVDGRRTVTLTFDPPDDLALEQALAAVETEVLPTLRALLPEDASLALGGSADQLDQIVFTMSGNIALALLVLFLLLAAMFKNLRDAALVLMTLPMAVLGGVLGLRALGMFSFQPLDLLSMIGFVMLLGMVVNNAILLIARAREGLADGLDIDAATRQALVQRLRPILIGALTGVVGALPLAVSPGPGAVIYRGLAAVSVGGVCLSLVFCALLIPAAMRLLASYRSAAPAVMPDAEALPAARAA